MYVLFTYTDVLHMLRYVNTVGIHCRKNQHKNEGVSPTIPLEGIPSKSM